MCLSCNQPSFSRFPFVKRYNVLYFIEQTFVPEAFSYPHYLCLRKLAKFKTSEVLDIFFLREVSKYFMVQDRVLPGKCKIFLSVPFLSSVDLIQFALMLCKSWV